MRFKGLPVLFAGLLWVSPGGAASATVDDTLETAFEAINSRALTPVVIGDLAYDGLRALTVIDPDLTIDRPTPRHVQLSYRGHPLALYPAPAKNNVDGWADLVRAIAAESAQASEDLRKAGIERVYAAVFDAALAHLDRFSRYAPPQEADDHRAARSGFGGIGVRCEANADDVTLVEVLPNTPAAKAHLQIGDHILAIDGTPLGGLAQEAVAKLIRGPVSSPVALTIRPRDQQRASVMTLTRDRIVPPTVALSPVSGGVATIAISSFNDATDVEMTAALANLGSKTKGLVLDLRGNPGGLLDQAVMVADLFMAHGPIVSTRGRHPATQQSYDAHPGGPAESLPLVVLVDGNSASAAEILAAALQDSGRAVLVGTNSYGKGTVQSVLTLPNRGELTLTWSRYYSPSGYALQDLGVLPNLCTAGQSGGSSQLLEQLAKGELPNQLAAWRASTIDQTDLRRQLRQICPGEAHGDGAADAVVAHSLLTDPALYAKALALGSSLLPTSGQAILDPATSSP